LQKIKLLAFKLAPETAYENAWGLDDALTYMESRCFSVYRYGNSAAYVSCELLFAFNEAANQRELEHQKLIQAFTELKQAQSDEVAINAALHTELELSRSISQDLHLDTEILTRQLEALQSLREAAMADHERTVANYEAQICQLAGQCDALRSQCDALELVVKDLQENSSQTDPAPTLFQASASRSIEGRDRAAETQILRAQTQIDLLKDLLVGREKE
jgi:hypothetical protein